MEALLQTYAHHTKPQWARCIARLPDHMHDGLVRYVLYGIMPGSFLTAVLENKFVEACCAADQANMNMLHEWALVMINAVPSDCQGSEQHVRMWREVGGLFGMKEDACEPS